MGSTNAACQSLRPRQAGVPGRLQAPLWGKALDLDLRGTAVRPWNKAPAAWHCCGCKEWSSKW